MLHFGTFFRRLYEVYDMRFVYAATQLAPSTRRVEWDPESPVLGDPRAAEYEPRLAGETPELPEEDREGPFEEPESE